MNTYPKEWNILLQMCRAGLGIKGESYSPQEVGYSNVNWEIFMHMARYHKIRPLVYKGINLLERREFFPAEIFLQLENHSRAIAYRNFQNTKELIRLGKLLDKEDIDYIPYKGVVLSQKAYADIAIRESSDIDILINLSDFKKVKEILITEGYVEELKIPSIFHGPYFRLYCEYNFDLYSDSGKRLFHVEPHWYTGSKMFQTHFSYKQIKRFVKTEKLFGNEFKVLSPEGLLITTAIHHGYSDRWNYLKNITDIAAIIRSSEESLDWRLVFAVCDELKITNLIIPGILIAHKCFEIDIPSEVSLRVTSKLSLWSDKRFCDFANRPSLKVGINNLASRVVYHLRIRRYYSTKFWVLYYHIIHVLLKSFIKKRKVTLF